MESTTEFIPIQFYDEILDEIEKILLLSEKSSRRPSFRVFLINIFYKEVVSNTYQFYSDKNNLSLLLKMIDKNFGSFDSYLDINNTFTQGSVSHECAEFLLHSWKKEYFLNKCHE